LIRLRITGGGRPPLLLLIGEEDVTAGFWRPQTSAGPLLVRGPYLVRHAELSGRRLNLTGDTKEAAPLELWAPSTVHSVSWNGKGVPGAITSSGSWRSSALLPGAAPIQLPELTDWRIRDGSPEAEPDFDDSHWQQIDGRSTGATVKPEPGQPVLDMSAYGFHQGDVWYRGRFTGGPDARKLALYYGAGGAGLLQLWLDGSFIGQHELPGGLPRPITTGIAEFVLPPEAQRPGEHLLAVMVRNDGHNWDVIADDAHKEPRGLISASLSRQDGPSYAVPIAWRIQGNEGGEKIADPVRGVMNNGGLYGERQGWHLPGFDDHGWSKTNLPPKPGTRWYRTTFRLDIPKEDDASIGLTIGDPDKPRSPGSYRALIFINGWNMGQFIANIGPQRTFVLPNGILNPNGENTLAIAVTGDGQVGNGLEPVRLVNLNTVRGGVPIRLVDSPPWRDPMRASNRR
jgi:hypothetical protein